MASRFYGGGCCGRVWLTRLTWPLLRSELLLSLDHGLDTVVHVLDEVLLRAAESAAVGDIEDAIAGVGVLATGSTDLDVPLVSNALESGPVLHEVGEMDVDGGAESGSEVGGARGDVTQVVVVSETSLSLDDGGGSGETLEDSANVGTLLHGDDTELILFIDPDEEGLGVVVEDTSARWPVTVESAGIEETVTLPKNKIIETIRICSKIT